MGGADFDLMVEVGGQRSGSLASSEGFSGRSIRYARATLPDFYGHRDDDEHHQRAKNPHLVRHPLRPSDPDDAGDCDHGRNLGRPPEDRTPSRPVPDFLPHAQQNERRHEFQAQAEDHDPA